MSTAVPDDSRWGFPLFVAGSLAVHAVLLLLLAHLEPGAALPFNAPLDVELVEVERPKPPEPPKDEPKPEPKKLPKPPIKVAVAQKPPPEPPKDQAPPPPNDAPPPQAPQKPVPLVVGISMSSTTAGGSFAAAVGNTLYGKTEQKAQDPSQVKAYSAPKYQPIHMVDSEPSVAQEVKPPYPPEARRAGVEGQVVLSLLIDDQGKVVEAKVLSGPGYGLDEAALQGIRKYRFRPAYKNGEAVSTEIKYTVTFVLD